jgi:DNA repair protein RecN (Recombination protein N)
MLAIEVVIAGSDPVPTFVFDEVDAGVGGAAAIEIGRRLARLAEQVAGHRRHPPRPGRRVRDEPPQRREGNRWTGHLVERPQLSGAEREAEMARLLSGLTDSESGLAHARELLEIAADRAA